MAKRSNLTTKIPPGGKKGQVIAKQSDKDYDVGWENVDSASGSTFGVQSFNGRTGDVSPKAGDYTSEMVGADPVGTAKTLTDKVKKSIPTKTSELQNDSGFTTIDDVRQEISTSGGSGSTGTLDHSVLINRDALDQHPMSAITGLANYISSIETELDSIPPPPEPISNTELEELLK